MLTKCDANDEILTLTKTGRMLREYTHGGRRCICGERFYVCEVRESMFGSKCTTINHGFAKGL